MAAELSALASPPDAPSESDYRSFCMALEASARGRAFLAEYARRNRNADTEMLLVALDRLETLVRADGSALNRLRDDLRLLLIAIRLARPDIDAATPLTKAAKLATLLDMLESRIDNMADSKPAEIVLPEEPAALFVEPERPPLRVVPPADEPELPMPQPAAAAPAIALVQEPGKIEPEPVAVWEPIFGPDHVPVLPAVSAAMPEITFIENAPAKANAATPAPAKRTDVLAAIAAMSDAERIALFT